MIDESWVEVVDDCGCVVVIEIFSLFLRILFWVKEWILILDLEENWRFVDEYVISEGMRIVERDDDIVIVRDEVVELEVVFVCYEKFIVINCLCGRE